MYKNLKPVFLRWILMMSMIGIGTLFAFTSGLMGQINEVDFTKISFIIFGTFLIFSVLTGILTYNVASDGHTDKSINKIIRQNEYGWFYSDAFIAAGMIGTVIGFILMMSGTFDNVGAGNVQNVIVFALSKMGLALYTTASGLVCSLLLKMQLFNLSQYIEKFKSEYENKKPTCTECE